MDNLMNYQSAWKEGVYVTMKNFFLYLSFRPAIDNSKCKEDIYCFLNKQIIAVDRNIYNMESRQVIQKDLGIRPYFLSQSMFMEILNGMVFSRWKDIRLKGIYFEDESIENMFEYSQLIAAINKNDMFLAYNHITEIIELYDTDIRAISIRYKGYYFNITKDGVMDTDAPDYIFYDFINDKIVNAILLGVV